MKKAFYILALCALASCACACKKKVDTPKDALMQQLLSFAEQGKIAYGHQDDLPYGHAWKVEDWETDDLERSDIKDVTGHYPLVMGFDLGDIEHGASKNLDGVPFGLIRKATLKHIERGGIVTFSWHPDNLLTGGDAWDVSSNKVVEAVLPGGEKHTEFMEWLRRGADFVESLGNVAIIFRPWHENSGAWFWWGRGLCSSEEYRALWNMTQEFVAKALPYNILWSWSPNYGFEPDELDTYPGNERVDIIGLDAYQQRGGEEAFISQLNKDLTTLCNMAKKSGKLVALTECGYQNIPDPTWWTRVLKPQIAKYPISYFLVWRNADRRQYFAPAKNTKDAEDFCKIVKDKRILMLNDIIK